MALVYSCCFWFSLRLGGILIGIFSLFQTALVLVLCCWAYNHMKEVINWITYTIDHFTLMYVREFLENFRKDLSQHIVFVVILLCIYIFVCLLFVYGAYMCNNVLMVAYILMELFRLAVISTLVATGLLLIKQNTMDIGILIGASVAGGFLLLGLFYLWICAANLPVLINEMERDEHMDTITKLRQLLEVKNQRNDGMRNSPREANNYRILNNRMQRMKPIAAPGPISVVY